MISFMRKEQPTCFSSIGKQSICLFLGLSKSKDLHLTHDGFVQSGTHTGHNIGRTVLSHYKGCTKISGRENQERKAYERGWHIEILKLQLSSQSTG